jgi:hypothetical protein
MIKVAAPSMACQVIDWAMQVHGGAGVSDDFPLAAAYASARTLRFADGPDEVHRERLLRPALSRALPAAGAQPDPGALGLHATPPASAHWELLLRARAVENLAYVLAPAQGGLHANGRRTWGHTMLRRPLGPGAGLLAGRGIEGLVLGELDAGAHLRAMPQPAAGARSTAVL